MSENNRNNADYELNPKDFTNLNEFKKVFYDSLYGSSSLINPKYNELRGKLVDSLRKMQNKEIPKSERQEIAGNEIARIETILSLMPDEEQYKHDKKVFEKVLSLIKSELTRIKNESPEKFTDLPNLKVKSVQEQIVLFNELEIISHLRNIGLNDTKIGQVLHLITKKELHPDTVRRSLSHLKNGTSQDPYKNDNNLNKVRSNLAEIKINLDEINEQGFDSQKE